MDINLYNTVRQWEKDQDGVFCLADLKVMLDEDSEATLFRKLVALVKSGVLMKVKRGIYATPTASLIAISSRIAPESYITTGTILAQKAMIGSVPARKVQAVKVGRPRTYQFESGTIEHLSIDPKLYFGFISENGIRLATPEKAFLDVCYFYYKGKRFSFDPASDINREALDFKLIANFLAKYDERFVTFFNRIWGTP